MHIPPVHNRCALDFVIGGIYEKCAASQADSKAGNRTPVAGADSRLPLYTIRHSGDLSSTPPATRLMKEPP
jgi:hypothetical protein